MTSRPGMEMLAQLAVADAACIVALPLAVDPAHAGRAALGALALLVAALCCWLLLHWLVADGRQRRVHALSEEKHLAIELRVVLLALFALAALAVEVHVSVMLAGFLTGLVVSAIGEPKRVGNQMFALSEGFFAPVFFVWLGASLDLRELVSHPSAIWLGLSLGGAAVLVHGALAVSRQPLPLALATSAQLGVPVGAAALASQLGIARPGEPTAMLLGAMVTVACVAVSSGRMQRLVQAPAGGGAVPGR